MVVPELEKWEKWEKGAGQWFHSMMVAMQPWRLPENPHQTSVLSILLMEEIRLTSWYGQYPIICRVSYMSRWCRISSINSTIHCYPVSCHWNFGFLENHSSQQPNIHTPSKTKGRFRQGNRAWGSSQLWNRTIQTTGIYAFRIWYMKYDDICGMPCVLLRYEIKQDSPYLKNIEGENVCFLVSTVTWFLWWWMQTQSKTQPWLDFSPRFDTRRMKSGGIVPAWRVAASQ